MKTSIRLANSTILILGRMAKICFFMVLLVSCKNNEPAFVVMGDKMVTKDVKVNIGMLKDDGTTMTTMYYNGKSYQIKNHGTLRYAIYVSYKDSLFYRCEMDNLHGELKGESINEIIVKKSEDGAILASYRGLKESSDTAGIALRPWNNFVAELLLPSVEKVNFTAFYETR
ncbi:hypothetical protein FA048_15690 [Pedobacter polaris]|uniref:Lipoprotein n=1 Tax=Pedobacter polaris TaxID=2571273 RepID=A0A4V5NZ27_9SPHI|nr:hypothetical protein [Pedobacter polaris]TKC06646.1 hypothetical protein FA048_15690 [Pedobacter polaris]